MIRLDRRPLRDPADDNPPARLQDCVVDDARQLLIHWTVDGSWEPAGEQGFLYHSPGLTFPFIANVGGVAAAEGRAADGRIFVLTHGLTMEAAQRLDTSVVRRLAMDIEAAMLLWPELVPDSLARSVFFWFPDRHATVYEGRPGLPAGIEASWFGDKVWMGEIA
ncbi:MAG: hypothetical protein AB7O88_20585 [Reyranellaceae bacterium]